MNTDGAHLEEIAKLPRAGFWRRWAATLIDWIVVAVPFQVLAVVLFATTSGMVQMHGGLFFNSCEVAKTIPQSLSPPPPHDANFATVCHVSLFGAATGVTLTVGRTTREGSTTKTVTQGYMLDQAGNPIDGFSLDWIVASAFVVYLVWMIWKKGRTVGARIVRIRIVDTADVQSSGVPILKVISRYLAMIIGFVPAMALLLYQRAITDGSADAMFTDHFFQWFIYSGLVAAIWSVLLIIQVARKTDPVYDRLAGTAVVRDQKAVQAAQAVEPGLQQA
ncbi:RDD family protein [Bradyrhizobium sp.]|uniref:RDD family protein n=1 Tax=Bradyrhizobium sp. TaxID=376 RepID=UPI003D0DC377